MTAAEVTVDPEEPNVLTRADLVLLDALPDAEVSEAVCPDKERDR